MNEMLTLKEFNAKDAVEHTRQAFLYAEDRVANLLD